MENQKLKPNPRDNANIFQKLIFSWLFPLVKKGCKRPLEKYDLFRTPKEHSSLYLGDFVARAWSKEFTSSPEKRSYVRALIRAFGVPYLLLGVLVCVTECVFKICAPVFLGILIRYFNKVPGYSESWGYGAAFGLIFANIGTVVFHQIFFFCAQSIGMKIRIASCALIYRKALRLNTTALGHTTVGQMVNLLSNDVSRFDNSVCFIHYLWVGPLQTIISTIILWHELGPSCLAAIFALSLYVPFQGYMGKVFSRLRLATALRTDERVRIMNEMMNAIRVIKMYAWEMPFKAIVKEARKLEIDVIMKGNYYRAVNMALFFTSAKLVIFLSLLAYALTGNILTAEKVFLTTALLNNIQLTMTLFFNFAISMGSETIVSCKRIQTFLDMEEKEEEETEESNSNLRPKPHDCFVEGKNISARWDPGSREDTLHDICFTVRANETMALIGSVGSGKTSLLHALLGELPLIEGQINAKGRIAYASQEPWLFSGTIRENILFGQPFNVKRYNDVIRVCALMRDLKQFPDKDETEVGERGVALSGGQKARISLARAIYFDADIYLLDDPLSAVDAEVGKHIFEECIEGYLRNKVTILATHQLQFLQETSHILYLQNGRIAAQGSYEELQKEKIDFSGIVALTVEDQTPPQNQIDDEEDYLITKVTRLRKASEAWNVMHGSVNSIHASVAKSISILALNISGSRMSLQDDGPFAYEENEYKEINDQSEKKTTGAVQFKIYFQYFMAGGGIVTTIIFILLNVIFELFYSGSSYWLSFWTNSEQLYWESIHVLNDTTLFDEINWNNGTDHVYAPEDRLNYVYIYSGITACLLVASLCRTVLYYRICMTSSKTLHNRMFAGVIRTSLNFFDTHPVGQILNRFTKDTGQVDDLLPPSMYDLITILFSFFGIVSLILYLNIWIAIPTAVLLLIFFFLRWIYISSARDVKRLEAITRSPVFTQLSSTFQGLPTIRAFKAQAISTIYFDSHQDVHTSAYYTFLSLSRAFGASIDIFSSFYIGLVTLSFMFQTNVLGGDAGLGISVAMLLSGMLQWGVKQSAEVENHMTSVERIIEYSKLEPEVSNDMQQVERKPGWPDKGKLSFKNVYLNYNKDQNPVLKDISFETDPAEKIGIVGRTGAGKSSLLSCIFRLTPPQGEIIIDDVRTDTLLLEDLRKSISIIPQDPTLFTGTVRYNLDPFSEYSDEEIWNSLEEVRLKDHVKDMNGSLEARISEGGSNLSVGQRQLMCLARAILKHNKILVMDEATANVDPQTDSWIQETIREKFTDCTVLTIAHRLHTIMDSDRVMVMDSGELKEFDSPHELLKNSESKFSQLVNQTGAAAATKLKEIAKEAYLVRKRNIPTNILDLKNGNLKNSQLQQDSTA